MPLSRTGGYLSVTRVNAQAITRLSAKHRLDEAEQPPRAAPGEQDREPGHDHGHDPRDLRVET